MKLSEAVKLLINEYDIAILSSNRLLNMLDDYNAFEDNAAYRSIFKTLISGGYLNEYLQVNHSKFDCENIIQKNIWNIHKNTGISTDLLYSVFNELQNGLGFSDIAIANNDAPASDNSCCDNDQKEKLYASGIDMDASIQDIAIQFVNMGYSVKLKSPNIIELIGVFSGIDNTTIRINGTTDGITTSISALLPLSTPNRDIAITRAMANQYTASNGLPEVGNDLFDSCEIVGNIIVNTNDSSVPPFFSRWKLNRGSAIIVYTPFNIEFSVIKNL